MGIFFDDKIEKMKLFSSFLIAAASADDSRGACTSILREKLEEYPVVGGEWDCSRIGKGSVACEVACDGAGQILDFFDIYNEKINTKGPRIRLNDCLDESKKGHRVTEKKLEGYSAEYPIQCVDLTLGNCESKAADVLSRQTENGQWSCIFSEWSKKYTCKLSCPSRTFMTSPVERTHTSRPGFQFSKCHTEDPELSFIGMSDGDKFECLTCDEKMERFSDTFVNGYFVKFKGRSRREATAYGGGSYGGNGGGGEKFSTFYKLKCGNDDEERYNAVHNGMPRYKCDNRSGRISKITRKRTKSQPCYYHG